MLIPFDQLFRRYKIQPAGVLHLGANTGQEAETYRQCGIDQVIWVEALPDIYAVLVEHTKDFLGHRALCACVSDVDGKEVKFNVASNHSQSSSFLEFGTHSVEHPTVKFTHSISMRTIRVDTLLAKNGIDLYKEKDWFLNIDLQGAELLALKGMGNTLGAFRYAYIEVNTKELYRGCPFVGEIDNFLAQWGFAGMETKMTGSGWGDKYYQKMR